MCIRDSVEGTSFNNKECASRFDLIDMVFVTGDANLMPWDKRAKHLMVFLKMCLSIGKTLLACSCAMYMIRTLTLNNIPGPGYITVVNNKGKGGSIKDLDNLTKKVEQLQASDYFLNNINGDLYQFQN